MKKLAIFLLILIAAVSVVYYAGPKMTFDPVSPKIEALNVPIDELEAFVDSNERLISGIKPENESQIIWADSVRQTDYAIVYLHGFSAGIMESRPVHMNLAKKFGCNLYLARLSQHGLEDTDAFLDITPVSLIESAKLAISIGAVLGKKVIVMSCSTGGTLSIYLAAHNPEFVHAQLLYSPNIEIYDGTAKMVNDPWGEVLLKKLRGDFMDHPQDRGTEKEKYWTIKYRTEGIIALQDLLEQTMTDDVFRRVNQPYFLGYYFKNEEEQDHVVSVEAMKRFYTLSATPSDQKVEMPFANVGNHVIASDITSNDWETVQRETSKFLKETLGLVPQE